MLSATYAAGVRRRYEDLPPEVQTWVEGRLGAPVRRVRNAVGGFSPGVAAVVATEAGDSLFVKAVDSGANPDAVRFYQAERHVTARLPRLDGVPAALGGADVTVGEETYTVLLFRAVDGQPPRHPWDPADLALVLDALADLSPALTPSPWPADPRDTRVVDFFRWWRRLAEDRDDPWQGHPWVRGRWDRLVEVEEQLRGELSGTTLSQTDLRADNLLISRDPLRGDRVWFVDWAHAQNAAPWLDAGTLLADVIGSRADVGVGGPVHVGATAREHPAMSAAGTGQLWRLVLGLAGALHGLARQPSPSGLPTLRRWQGATADTLLAWCAGQDVSRPG